PAGSEFWKWQWKSWMPSCRSRNDDLASPSALPRGIIFCVGHRSWYTFPASATASAAGSPERSCGGSTPETFGAAGSSACDGSRSEWVPEYPRAGASRPHIRRLVRLGGLFCYTRGRAAPFFACLGAAATGDFSPRSL